MGNIPIMPGHCAACNPVGGCRGGAPNKTKQKSSFAL